MVQFQELVTICLVYNVERAVKLGMTLLDWLWSRLLHSLLTKGGGAMTILKQGSYRRLDRTTDYLDTLFALRVILWNYLVGKWMLIALAFALGLMANTTQAQAQVIARIDCDKHPIDEIGQVQAGCWGWLVTHTYNLRGPKVLKTIAADVNGGPSELGRVDGPFFLEVSSDGVNYVTIASFSTIVAPTGLTHVGPFSMPTSLNPVSYVRIRAGQNEQGVQLYVDWSGLYLEEIPPPPGGVTLTIDARCGPTTPQAGQPIPGVKVLVKDPSSPIGVVVSTPTSQNHTLNSLVELEVLDLQLVACHQFGVPITVHFSHWEVNGVPQPLGLTKISVNLIQNTSAVAIYEGLPPPPVLVTLSISANCDNARLKVTPPGVVITGPSWGSFTYAQGDRVTLEALDAQLPSCGMLTVVSYFDHWEINGVPQLRGQRVLNLTLTQNTNAKAIYSFTSPPSPISGDVNGDGVIDARDLARLDEAISGVRPLSAEEFQRADVAKKCGVNTLKELKKDRKAIAKFIRRKGGRVKDNCLPGTLIGQPISVQRSEPLAAPALPLSSERVSVQVFDLRGNMVFDEEIPVGATQLSWRGLTSDGRMLANGVYLYVITARTWDGKIMRSEAKKLVILR